MVFYTQLEQELMKIFYNLDSLMSESDATHYIKMAKNFIHENPKLREKWEPVLRCYAKENKIDYDKTDEDKE